MNPKTRYANEMLSAKQTRKILVLDAAERIFTDKGIERTTMQDIANEANLGVATVFRFFPKKEKLVVAVVTRRLESVLEDFQAIADKPLSCFQKIELLFDHYISLFEIDDSSVKLMENFDSFAAHYTEPLEDIESFYSVYQKVSKVFSTIIEQGMHDGSIRTDLPPNETLTTVVNAFVTFARKLSLQKNILVVKPDLPSEEQLVLFKHCILSFLKNPA